MGIIYLVTWFSAIVSFVYHYYKTILTSIRFFFTFAFNDGHMLLVKSEIVAF